MMKTHLQTSRVHQQTLLSPVASAIPSSSWLLCNLRGGGVSIGRKPALIWLIPIIPGAVPFLNGVVIAS